MGCIRKREERAELCPHTLLKNLSAPDWLDKPAT